MKIFFTTVLFVSIIAQTAAQTTIPNSDFENWSTFGSPPTDYEDPTGWKSTNGSVAFNAQPVNKSTDSHTGTYAAEIKVTTVFGNIPPVILTNGNVPNDFSDYAIDYHKAGTPITIKPISVSGYYKFIPDVASFDSAYAIVILKRWNGSTSDTVGLGSLTFAPAASYSQFNIPVTYSSSEMPDSIVVAFFNKATQEPSFNPAGKFLVDDISLDTINTFIGNLSTLTSLTIYPNPLSMNAYVSIEGLLSVNDCMFTVYNVLGEEVLRTKPLTSTFTIQRNSLSSGLYFYRMSNGSGEIANGKMLVE